MGYYTYFQLEAYDESKEEVIDNEVYEKLLSDFKKVTDYEYIFDDTCKWYDQEQDTLEVSKMNPKLYILISGQGEESGDVWKRVYKDAELIASWDLEISEPDFQELLKEHSK